MLNIKPVLAIEDGKIVSIGKARGSKNGNNKLREKIEQYHGIDYKKPYAVAYSGLDDSLLENIYLIQRIYVIRIYLRY